MRIAVDAMGGDHAPQEVIKGALKARDELDIEPILVGDEGELKLYMGEMGSRPMLEIVHAPEKMTMADSPRDLRKKRGASIIVAARMVQEGRAKGLVSAGSTGAAMVATTFILGRIKGVKRPVISTVIPTRTGVTLLLDIGASMEHNSKILFHSALMGMVYAEKILGIENPRIGLLNVGEEATKGNQITQKTYEVLMRSCPGFLGNAEGHDIFSDDFDVIVTDGFVGNITLKVIEGTASMITGLFRQQLTRGFSARLGTFFLRKNLRGIRNQMDYSSYGGAPLLGVKGNVIIGHGRSRALAIRNAIRIATEMARQKVVESISLELQSMANGAGRGDEDAKCNDNRDRFLCTGEGPHQSGSGEDGGYQ